MVLNFALLYLVTLFISDWNWLYSLYIAVLLTGILALCGNHNPFAQFEYFDNNSKLNTTLEKVEEHLADSTKPNYVAANAGSTDGIAGADPLELLDIVDRPEVSEVAPVAKLASSASTPSTYSTLINTRDLATAQRETFQLIDSVRQLKDVISTLSPTLKEGRKVIEMMNALGVKPGGVPGVPGGTGVSK